MARWGNRLTVKALAEKGPLYYVVMGDYAQLAQALRLLSALKKLVADGGQRGGNAVAMMATTVAAPIALQMLQPVLGNLGLGGGGA